MSQTATLFVTGDKPVAGEFVEYSKKGIYLKMAKQIALITGITGMVGSHLADFLLEHTDWDIYGMARWRSPLDNISHLLPRVNSKDRVFLIHGDLRDSLSMMDVVREVRPNFVFHLAAQSFPKTSFSAP